MSHTYIRKYLLPRRCTDSLIPDFKAFFEEAESWRGKYQAKMLLSKFADPSPREAAVRRQRAIQKWRDVNDRNAKTNERLLLHVNGDNRLAGRTFDSHLSRAAKLIARVVGHEPPASLQGSFSGGASTSLKRRPGMVERKYAGKLDVTASAQQWFLSETSDYPLWDKLNPRLYKLGNRESSIMFTVPKNDTIDRVACKEPDANMWLQKAVGDFFRDRLKRRAGINLNDQTINKDHARAGAALGQLATIDLSSASDSVTTQLVCRLLPVGWFVYLQDIRVHSVDIDGQLVDLEMFSTMGNGFTFELESLIFWALAKTCTNPGDIVSVYGDDIIVPSRAYPILRTLLNYCGFTVNLTKSFAKGLFRESCGGHYHGCTDVTPFYIRRPVTDVSQLIHLLNALRKWGSLNGSSSWVDDSVEPLWRKYAKFVPRMFWGGTDLTSVETLASPTGLAKRLMKAKKVISSNTIELGGYLNWHAVARSRNPIIVTSDGLQRPLAGKQGTRCTKIVPPPILPEPQQVQVELKGYVVRRKLTEGCRAFGAALPLFPSEVDEKA